MVRHPISRAALRARIRSHKPGWLAKASTTPWTEAPPGATTGATGGYYWLAYEPLNYCTSCKTCNEDLKKTLFPIQGATGQAPNRVSTLNRKEKPLLLYPLSDIDNDPEEHITFMGHLAGPTRTLGQPSPRGEATITLFDLNGRRELLEGRTRAILVIHGNLPLAAEGDLHSLGFVRAMQQHDKRFAGAVRAWVRLWHRDRPTAERMARALEAWLSSLP